MLKWHVTLPAAYCSLLTYVNNERNNPSVQYFIIAKTILNVNRMITAVVLINVNNSIAYCATTL